MRFLLIALTLLVAGCGSSGPPRIDGTNKETFQASMAELKQDLPDDEREQFTKALGQWMARQSVAEAFTGKQAPEIIGGVMRQLDGKTAEEIMLLVKR